MAPSLEGIRVLDLSQRVAGPYASTILADFGAEVIRVEPLDRKTDKPITAGVLGMDHYHFTINRNKKSLLLNLKHPKGKDIFYGLVKKSDVVLNNYRPGVLQRLGIDHPSLSRINPRIICCSVTGYGCSGPYSQRPTFDGAIQALAGIMSVTGDSRTGPVLAGIPVVDFSTPLFAASGILAALYDREKTGLGQDIEVSLLASAVSLLQYQVGEYFATGRPPGPVGSGRNMGLSPPYGAFKTKDRYIFIAGHRRVEAFYKVIGREDILQDSRFDTSEKRIKNSEKLLSIIDKIILTKSLEEWLRLLEAEDIPCSPINTVDKVFCDPQVLHLGILIVQEKAGQEIKIIGSPIKMPGSMTSYESAAFPGENTEEVLSRLLDYDEETIQKLKAEEVVL